MSKPLGFSQELNATVDVSSSLTTEYLEARIQLAEDRISSHSGQVIPVFINASVAVLKVHHFALSYGEALEVR